MAKARRTTGLPNLFLVAIAGMVLLGSAIYLGVNVVVDRAVTVDAENKAADWAGYFIASMPEMEALVESGTLTPAQRHAIATAEQLGDVFRFKLFDATGGLVLVSDEIETSQATAREHSDKARAVLATGESDIALIDGSNRPDRPQLFVEAYVPVRDAAGAMTAVVEVYLDQTETAQLFRSSFATLGIGLAVIAALAFGLPTLAFLLRSRQASEARREAAFLASHDPMTNALNRASFTAALDERRRQRPGETLAVALFNADDIKGVNGTHGEAGGDALILHMARAIAACFREAEHLLGRFGGDVFAVAVWGQDEAGMRDRVEAAMRAIRQPIPLQGRTISGRVRAGVYFADAAAGVEEIVGRTEVALYQAKIDGGNTCRVFTEEMETNILARRRLEQKIRDALEQGRFELHYQPLLDARSQSCAGFEALLRLPDGEGGHVPPSVFIPVAEGMGLINEIGKWVVGRATQTAAGWPEDLFVSVNLSVKQFGDGKLIGDVQEALRRSGLQPSRLELEVTESVLMENTDAVAAQVRALRSAGISIAMDDFGTGYSSLGYLWQFGFDKLKIDRSFVAALDVQDAQARDILDTIIMLGHRLNMTVTAEGIETKRQAEVLAALACDQFQGYFYGRPAPASEIPAFLAANRLAARAPAGTA